MGIDRLSKPVMLYAALVIAGAADTVALAQTDASPAEKPTDAQDGDAAATGFPLFDNQRVELLRGPQGTLFGRNATGDLVQFISNQPTAGTSGYASVSTGSFDLRRAEGAINVGSDTLAVRLAGQPTHPLPHSSALVRWGWPCPVSRR
jgi:iron complex outermembrane receptor protein